MVSLAYAKIDTPLPSLAWTQLSDSERLKRVKDALKSFRSALDGNLVMAGAKQDGQVIVSLVQPIPASKRGQLLLDLEEFLKQAVEPSLAVWLEPLGDRNSLRNLRGIEVKA